MTGRTETFAKSSRAALRLRLRTSRRQSPLARASERVVRPLSFKVRGFRKGVLMEGVADPDETIITQRRQDAKEVRHLRFGNVGPAPLNSEATCLLMPVHLCYSGVLSQRMALHEELEPRMTHVTEQEAEKTARHRAQEAAATAVAIGGGERAA